MSVMSIFQFDATFVRNNVVLLSITIFIMLFTVIHMVKPGFIYNKDGSLRQFGVGRKLSTVLPSWLLAILLAIFSYLIVIVLLQRSN